MINPADYPISFQHRLEGEIISKKFSPGTKFLYKDLEDKFNTESSIIEKVLPSLVRKGLVTIGDNRTIIVNKYSRPNIESVFQYSQKSKLKPRTIVRSVTVQRSTKEISERLMLEISSPIYIQIRTRLINNEILANQYNFIPYEICPGLEDIDLSQRSFQVTLEEQFHTIISRINEEYTLDFPSRDDSLILNVSENEKILIVQRTSYSSSNFPLVFADIHVNPKLYHYVKDLWPEAEKLLLHKDKK